MPFGVIVGKFHQPKRHVTVNQEKLERAIAAVLDNGGRMDFDDVKVYECKNVIRIDIKITEVI